MKSLLKRYRRLIAMSDEDLARRYHARIVPNEDLERLIWYAHRPDARREFVREIIAYEIENNCLEAC